MNNLKSGRLLLSAVCVILSIGLVFAAEKPVVFTRKPVLKEVDGKTKISFAVSRPTDAEVAVLDAKGKVVRHLAAGMLGGKTPPPMPLKQGLSQAFVWDGKDDYGETARGGPFCVRVRCGMDVKLDRIVGGDPYAFYSRDMGQGDHAAWRITGLEVKPDGTVYVLGNANNYGPPALRAYEADGNYLRTIFPPPAGKPPEKVKGWGIVEKKDGTYAFRYNDLASPALSKTFICGTRGHVGRLVPTHDTGTLTVMGIGGRYRVMDIGTDGSLPAYRPRPLFGERAVPGGNRLIGPFFAAPAADDSALYVSGLYSCKRRLSYSRVLSADTGGFWRDGQVWKIDLKTGGVSVFFALDGDTVPAAMKARGASSIADTGTVHYASLHGVAADRAGHLFVCDRLNGRVLVLDRGAKVVREIPVRYPDAVAVHPNTRSLYVTTRFGHYHEHGRLKLVKFNDWTRDTKPSVEISLCSVGTYPLPSYLAVAMNKRGEARIWVAYVTLPVRIYRDRGTGLEPVKDFYESGQRQRCLDMQHMVADPATERVFFAEGFQHAFMIKGWDRPRFESCMESGNKMPAALSLAVDYRNRLLYTAVYMRGRVKHSLWRYRMDGMFFAPAPVGASGTHAVSGDHRVSVDWRIGLGLGSRGIAVAPDGSLAALGATGFNDYSGPLYYFAADEKNVPWKAVRFACLGKNPASGGVRFDPAGNLYVGLLGRSKWNGKIVKFTPTSKTPGGNPYPVPPEGPSMVYDIRYGYPHPGFSRTPRFGVDGWGRIYYPTPLEPRVSVIDNEGNEILHFGTYGNRDSMGGLEGDLVPTKDVPMAWPNSVDATDDYVYVADIVNIRLLRLKKTFVLESTCPLGR